ncbi:histidine kinase [Psychromonas sp. psych-6C06]|uniref:ATP-binding protein n=1 Tax=Psychromonas sp. psych-6C06 TaxID=2058089 RepID=UPI000C349579|nr:ATP-binding protein [Psychromonas sp. psych-6C06]PKF61667.1 histidine kinase [Psychromonas sp. psych-6C06]
MLTLLCVDSDCERLIQIKQDLQPLDGILHIAEANNLAQASKFILQNSTEIALILSAQCLDDGNALSLFRYSQCQLIRKIIYAQSPSLSQVIECINQGHIDYFLQLPYQKSSFKKLIQTQISNYSLTHHQRKKLSQSDNNELTINQTESVAHNSTKATSEFKDKFLDYSLYSDSELSHLVITSLYKILENNDEHNIRRSYHANHILTREGQKNRYLWFIIKGKVLLKKRNAQGETQDITIMQAGSMVGGMSFLTEEAAFSTGIAIVDTEVLKLDNVIFSQIMQSNTSLLAPFTNLLLRNFNRRLQHSISTELALQETLKSLDVAHNHLIESEKMAVLGQLVSGVAHELNNPVAAILRGSESLITLISTLLRHGSKSEFANLVSKTLQQGLTVTPLSTSEVRARTKKLLKTVKDKNIAKKLVNMALDRVDIPTTAQRDFTQTVNLLSQYHQVGTILRNSNACATRIADLVKSLKHYAGQDSASAAPTDIHEGIEETLIIFESKLKNYRVTKEYQQLPQIECHPIELEQVWTNIISNAIDATGNKGEIQISTLYLPYDESPMIQVVIEDNGPGIPNAILDKIFELNYTSKSEGNFGLGIGLTICSQIIKRHGGTIEVESEVNAFTRFIITLPVFNAYIESSHSAFFNTSNKEQ